MTPLPRRHPSPLFPLLLTSLSPEQNGPSRHRSPSCPHAATDLASRCRHVWLLRPRRLPHPPRGIGTWTSPPCATSLSPSATPPLAVVNSGATRPSPSPLPPPPRSC